MSRDSLVHNEGMAVELDAEQASVYIDGEENQITDAQQKNIDFIKQEIRRKQTERHKRQMEQSQSDMVGDLRAAVGGD